MGVVTSIDLNLDASIAFDVFAEDLIEGLARRGFTLEPAENGRVFYKGSVNPAGKVLSWRPPKVIELEWISKNWKPEKTTRVKIMFEPNSSGTIATITNSDWNSSLFDEDEKELIGWFATELIAPFLASTHFEKLGDWITDRRARRPSGARSRAVYGDPVFHRPNFKAILRELSLKPEDYLLEVGCGGGAFLHEALESGCRAAAIDHSPDMIRLASEVNREAIAQQRLEIQLAEAGSIPFPDGIFSRAAMTGVLLFLPDALLTFKEIYRVVGKGGCFVLFTGTKETRGTPASPEPIASRLHFYEDAELLELARKAGFSQVRVDHPDLGPFAREAGLTEDQALFFAGRPSGSQLMIATKE